MHELPNAKQDSGLSKLDRLKAILEESKRKKAASLQGVLPASLPDTSHEKALPNSTAPAAGNSCDGTGAVHSSGPTSSEQTSEKAKKLKELLERKAQKRVTVQQLLSSPTPPALERVSNNDRKGGETSPTGPSSSEPHSKKDGNDKGVSRFPHSRLPLGMRVPVVIIRLEEDEKLIYLQEVSALRDLVKMVKALNAVVSLEKQIEEPVPGDLVAVLHKEDSTWYRGQIGLVKHNEKDAASGDRVPRPIDRTRALHKMTTKLTTTPPGISVLQRYRLMQIRSEYGIHYMFSTPHNVLTQKLSFEFATGFLKNSTLTMVVEVETGKAMEIQYESTKYQNRYLYFRREADGAVSVGTKGLVHGVHHHHDIKLRNGIALTPGIRSIRFIHDSSGNLSFGMRRWFCSTCEATVLSNFMIGYLGLTGVLWVRGRAHRTVDEFSSLSVDGLVSRVPCVRRDPDKRYRRRALVFEVTLDGGDNILAETVSAENLVSCSRVKHGVPYFDQQDSTDLMNFKVHELHHGSEDPKVLFEHISKDKGDGYTLPPFVFVETGGKIVFSGKFHGRSLPTNKISVMYGGKEATTVQGPPLDRQAWLLMQFYTTKIAISLADSRSQEPSVISRFRVKDDGTIDPTDKGTVKAITINRHFQVDNVFVVSA
ncbi:uncharacterized protein LOC119167212 [Rhipicephalus microplus]|uniref:uncharacterized protein LOC119167212 n=1 Tax=Rhipicephalus microplus TaxID=6941 RepID=UPI003F6B1CF7